MIKIAYSTISYGSSGSDVKKLQKMLNDNGYSLSVDGQFGSKTQSAVKDYQKKNGLSVDGIVGNKTWGMLNKKTSVSSSTTSSTANKTSVSALKAPTETKRPVYTKSNNLIQTENMLSNWEKNSPKEYKSQYSDKIDEILDSILNREKFSYNMNADPLYRQYKEQYVENGKKAMMDTLGQASALTGGYLNSYATVAGNQAYDEYLSQLNDIALDLRDRAYEMYSDENDRMIDDITVLRSLDGDDYEKYLGRLERYYSDGNYLLEKLVSMSDAEYEAFLAETEAWESDREYAYEKYKNAQDRKEFEEEMAFKKSESKRDQENADRNYALAVKKASTSSSSRSSNSSSKSSSSKKKTESSTKVAPKSYREFKDRTGITTILKEDEFKTSAYIKQKYSTYQEYLEEMYDRYLQGE